VIIQQNQIFPTYEAHCKFLKEAYENIKTKFSNTYVEELMQMRGYISDSMKNLISEMQLGYCDFEPSELYELNNEDNLGKELGLITSKDNFLLANRFIIPVDDVAGNLVSLIGYYADKKKYITLPTPFFSKEAMFFNFRQAYDLAWSKFDGMIIVVEGIFDCLSLRSIGLPCIATMGATVSGVKCELLKLFKKVVAIPDADVVGRKGLDIKTGWQLPSTATRICLKLSPVTIHGQQVKLKDIDDLVKIFDEEDIRDMILEAANSKAALEYLVI
jgi:DNA primase